MGSAGWGSAGEGEWGERSTAVENVRFFKTLFEYECWANALVNDSIGTARAALERDGAAAEAPALIRAAEIWAHVQAARRLWLSRLGYAEPPEEGLFPIWPPRRAVQECAILDAMWTAYITQRLDPAECDRQAKYTTTEGQRYSSTVHEILAHVVNHSTYHRGQIARLVAEAGGTPPATDFILFTRRSL